MLRVSSDLGSREFSKLGQACIGRCRRDASAQLTFSSYLSSLSSDCSNRSVSSLRHKGGWPCPSFERGRSRRVSSIAFLLVWTLWAYPKLCCIRSPHGIPRKGCVSRYPIG